MELSELGLTPLAALIVEVDQLKFRVRALEVKARDYQEDGELAAVDYEDRTNDPPDGFAATASRNPDYLLARMRTLQRTNRELRERAEMAERERDEARGEVGGWSQVATDAITERDALREAVRKHGTHLSECPFWDLHRPPGAFDCTCGLAAALASATPAEGGEG